ncbi:39S ribosomal protein L11, mitochondrial isoform X1 [Gambusia affinis]|uniref:39S ribosomal protein L11, mitochondrial isoform X1 n=1 Tax=Gambusia affinis TaxID=33528 RepID=UPI001CDB873B|nr:39S ribosomal protein L11, mitochondrial isoform X1 [Gambusia affinis]
MLCSLRVQYVVNCVRSEAACSRCLTNFHYLSHLGRAVILLYTFFLFVSKPRFICALHCIYIPRWWLSGTAHVWLRLVPDRTYDLKIGQPTVSFFLKQAAGIAKGASKTGHETAGMVSVKAVYEIAKVKGEDECFKIRDASLETVVKTIIGSARSLGIQIVNDLSADEYKVFLEQREEKLKADAAAAAAAAAAEAAAGKKK